MHNHISVYSRSIVEDLHWFQWGSATRNLMTKNFTIFSLKNIIIARYLLLWGLHEGRPSLKPPEENIQQFKTIHFFNFLFCGSFLPTDSQHSLYCRPHYTFGPIEEDQMILNVIFWKSFAFKIKAYALRTTQCTIFNNFSVHLIGWRFWQTSYAWSG